jgi:dsDNA-specific endonuclease/ATPase MutS2
MTIPPDDEPVPLPIEEVIDLHAFHPRDVKDLVADYLTECALRGFREVRIIHGRGIGALRETVRAVLARDERVEWFGDAEPGRGHWGATVVRLKPGGDDTSR